MEFSPLQKWPYNEENVQLVATSSGRFGASLKTQAKFSIGLSIALWNVVSPLLRELNGRQAKF